MVRQRRAYSPGARPGSSAAQWALASFIGQTFGLPDGSKPIVSFGMDPPGRLPPHFGGGGRMRASIQGAVEKYGSSADHPLPAGDTQTCTFESPETPT